MSVSEAESSFKTRPGAKGTNVRVIKEIVKGFDKMGFLFLLLFFFNRV